MRKEIKEFVKALKPIKDFSKVKPGTKIFSIHSISTEYIDTFSSYNSESNRLYYTNAKGEHWGCYVEENEWYFAE